MWEDPIVAEVRAAREQLSAEFNFDLDAIFADIRKRQVALGARLVSPKKPELKKEAGDVKEPSPSQPTADTSAAILNH
jgi:hypothetical protein